MATNKQIDQYFAGQTEPIQGQITDAQNNYAQAKEKLNGIAEQGKNDLQASFNRYDKGLLGDMRGAGNHTGMVDSARFGVRNGLGQGYGEINKQLARDNADLSAAADATNRTLNAELDRYKALAEAEKFKKRTGRGKKNPTPIGKANEIGAYDVYEQKYGRIPDGYAAPDKLKSRVIADDRYFMGTNASSNYRDIIKEYEAQAKADRKEAEEAAKKYAEANAKRSAEARSGSAMWG